MVICKIFIVVLYFTQARDFFRGREFLQGMMRTAVTNNCADFVRLLLEHGVSLRHSFIADGPLSLYRDVRLKLHFLFILKVVNKNFENDWQ